MTTLPGPDRTGAFVGSVAEVLATYNRYLAAFIAGDLDALNAVVSYPLAHIAETEVRMHDAFPINPIELRRTKAWHTTVNSRFEVVATSSNKAHVVLYHADRTREDGSLIETVSALYVFKRTSDGWRLYAISDLVSDSTVQMPKLSR
jgi:hypothetical protein